MHGMTFYIDGAGDASGKTLQNGEFALMRVSRAWWFTSDLWVRLQLLEQPRKAGVS